MDDEQQSIPWICEKCNKAPVERMTKVHYLEGNFEVPLLKCPDCGRVFISEELALGKMLAVEKGLEDK